MVYTSSIARKMGLPENLVISVARDLGILEDSNVFYKISDENISKLKFEVQKFAKDEVQKYIKEFGNDHPETKKLAKEYKMENLLEEEENELELENLKKENETLTTENETLKSKLSEIEEREKREKEKLAETLKRIKTRFFSVS